VLVVDDHPDGCESLSLLLQLDGHQVATAQDGESALIRGRDFRPDVILLDIGLPGMSGLDVARLIRQDPALRDVLLVAITGYGQDQDRRRCHEAGFDLHLIKPVDPNIIREMLANLPLANAS
jgi:CheY-like chemotaxis protein